MKTYRISICFNPNVLELKGDELQVCNKSNTISIIRNIDECKSEIVAVYNISNIIGIRLADSENITD